VNRFDVFHDAFPPFFAVFNAEMLDTTILFEKEKGVLMVADFFKILCPVKAVDADAPIVILVRVSAEERQLPTGKNQLSVNRLEFHPTSGSSSKK
jgi:hypothetical protein